MLGTPNELDQGFLVITRANLREIAGVQRNSIVLPLEVGRHTLEQGHFQLLTKFRRLASTSGLRESSP